MSVQAAERSRPARAAAGGHRCGKGKCTSGCTSCSHETKGRPASHPEAPGVGSELAAGIAGLRGTGTPLPPADRAYFEPRLGADLSGVRLQTGARAAAAAERLDARAFTLGTDVFFGSGEYRPGSAEGNRLLAHELAHVVESPTAPALQPRAEPEIRVPPEVSRRDAELLARHLISPRSGPGSGFVPPRRSDPGRPPGRPPRLPSMPTADDLGAFGTIDDACEQMRKLGLLPVQRGVYWKGHPDPKYPTACNTHPDAPYLEDPMIPSGAKCRGVCGPDCAKNCRARPDQHRCVPDRGGLTHSICIYKGVQTCGSHRGCRNHDACYDWCSEHGYDDIGDRCHRWCDLGCLCDYDMLTCVGWALGNGPFDREMTFYDESISQTIGPFPGACPTGAALSARAGQFVDLQDPLEILEVLARAPESERLHLYASPPARERLLTAVGFWHRLLAMDILRGAPSWRVPSLDAATVFLADRAIHNQHRDVALTTILVPLHRRRIVDPTLATFRYVGGAHAQDAVTFFSLTVDPDTRESRATAPVRVEVYDRAFADTGWLFSTVMHEHVHVLQVLHGFPAREMSGGDQRPEFAARDEVESYLWEIEHAVGTGLIRRPDQMSDLGRRLTGQFAGMTQDLQNRYRARYDAARALVARVAAGQPQLGVDDARRELERTSREIAELLSRRRGRQDPRIDAQIEEVRRRRAAALATVALVENPALETVRAGEPGTYRVASADAAGRIRYLYGGLSVGWHLAPASTSAYTLGTALGVGGQMSVAGTAIQGRVHPFPPDIDFDEHIHLVAETRREAAERAAQQIVDGIRRISGGPVPGREDLEFRHLVSYPVGSRGGSMSLGQLLRPDAVTTLARMIVALNGGNLNTFWRGYLADGRFINITRVVYVSAATRRGTPLLTAVSNPDFNLAFLEDPDTVETTPLAAFAWEMCCDARRRARRGSWLKAAKRAYNYFSTIGDVRHMNALEPVFRRPEAEMEMYASIVDALYYALLERDQNIPEPRTRILSATAARGQAETVARAVLEKLPDTGAGPSPRAIAKELREVAAQFRSRDRFGNLAADPALAERLQQRVLYAIRDHVSAGVRDLVRPVIEGPLAAACPKCGSRRSAEP
jgi:hypothetical protein